MTLVVASMVAGVLGQALFQLARIERLLEGGQASSLADAVRADWVRSAIESMLPGEVGSSERLVGSDRELEGLSADVPALPAPGLAKLHLRLEYVAALDATHLQLLAPSAAQGTAASAPVVLLSWPGREGRLRYLDEAGAWQENWPQPLKGSASGLPLAIMVETGLPTLPALVAVTRASPVPAMSRRQVEAL